MGKSQVQNFLRPPPPFRTGLNFLHPPPPSITMAKTSNSHVKTTSKLFLPPPPPPFSIAKTCSAPPPFFFCRGKTPLPIISDQSLSWMFISRLFKQMSWSRFNCTEYYQHFNQSYYWSQRGDERGLSQGTPLPTFRPTSCYGMNNVCRA